jgi:adenosine deaminase/adenosine deaminase CECR1
MKDHWLHMVMFNYCHTKFPDVKYWCTRRTYLRTSSTWRHRILAMLFIPLEPIVLDMELTWRTKQNHTLLRYMAKNKVAIEINLVSNEFILKSQRKSPSHLFI